MQTKSLFWEVTSQSTTAPSVLYGTIHLGTEECMSHWDKAALYIERYDRVFTESSVDQESTVFIQPFSLLGATEHVHDYITKRRWEKMRSVFLKYCAMDIDQFKMLKPLFILSQLQANLVGASSTVPLDYKIWQTAERLGKQTFGIETPQEQVNILQKLDIAQQFLQLVRMSKNITKTKKKLKAIITAYANEDIHKLYKMSKDSLGKDRSVLISERNAKMAKRLLNYHNEEPSFFSFGAGHLSGGAGVLRLLKQSGAVIRPV